jgi:hypothetical protein
MKRAPVILLLAFLAPGLALFALSYSVTASPPTSILGLASGFAVSVVVTAPFTTTVLFGGDGILAQKLGILDINDKRFSR